MNWSQEKLDLLKSTVCKGKLSPGQKGDDEFQLFLHVAKTRRLDPFLRQIYCLKRGGDLSIECGIDGLRLLADRTGRYCPGRATEFIYDDDGKLVEAIAHLKKQTEDGTWHEVSGHARYDESVAMHHGKPGGVWGTKPHVMLSKVCESHLLRRCFPADLSGLYTTSEMESVGDVDAIEPDVDEVKAPVWWADIKKYFGRLDVTEDMLFGYLGITSPEELGDDHRELLRSAAKNIQSDDAYISTYFSPAVATAVTELQPVEVEDK